MLKLGVVLQYNGLIASGHKRRDLGEAIRRSNAEALAEWHVKTMPEHFTWKGAYKYRYALRSPKYNRKKHNKPPLVKTGMMMKQAMSNYSISATGKNGLLVMRGLRAVNFSGKTYRFVSLSGHYFMYEYPDMRAELTAQTQDELQEIAAKASDRIAEILNQLKGIKTVRAE